MKLKLKLSVMTLSIILASCGSVVIERCNVRVIDNKCRCHEYQVERKNPRRIGESKDYPLSYCDNHVSMSADDWGELLKILMDVGNKKDKDTVNKVIMDFDSFSKGDDLGYMSEELF